MELTISDLKPLLPGLEAALDDEAVSEVMINGPGIAFVERDGRMAAVDVPELTTEAAARAAVQIARPLGKDPNAEPIIDARLADGSRVAICGPPAAPTAAITIRRFGGRAFTVEELTESGSPPATVVEEAAAVLGRERNLLISGGTGSGKTTLLNALVSLLPADGRIIIYRGTRWSCGCAAPTACGWRRGARRPRRDDPRPSAARAAPPSGPCRRRRGPRGRGRRPASGAQHRPRRFSRHRPREQRRRCAVAPCDLRHAGIRCAAAGCNWRMAVRRHGKTDPPCARRSQQMKGCQDVGPWAGRPRAQMMKSDEVEAMLHLRALGWG